MKNLILTIIFVITLSISFVYSGLWVEHAGTNIKLDDSNNNSLVSEIKSTIEKYIGEKSNKNEGFKSYDSQEKGTWILKYNKINLINKIDNKNYVACVNFTGYIDRDSKQEMKDSKLELDFYFVKKDSVPVINAAFIHKVNDVQRKKSNTCANHRDLFYYESINCPVCGTKMICPCSF